ncbi:MAG: hypothetical protein ACLUTC_12300 [Anaerobutyricum hallii]
MEYSRRILTESRNKREQNINGFLAINRDGLKYESLERRLCLYTTLIGEKVYIQYPGKESEGQLPNPNDFRPKLMMQNGQMMQDASFGFIWDIFDSIGKKHNDYLSFVATLFIRMQYLQEYEYVEDSYKYEEIEIDGNEETLFENGMETLKWNKLQISEDVWYTLNDRIGMIEIPQGEISFEGFIKLIDLLFQNEDCKYYYKQVIRNNQNFNWGTTGRPNTVSTNLRVLRYLENKEKLSDLLNAIQKGRGVMSFPKADYSIVTDNMVINIDNQ